MIIVDNDLRLVSDYTNSGKCVRHISTLFGVDGGDDALWFYEMDYVEEIRSPGSCGPIAIDYHWCIWVPEQVPRNLRDWVPDCQVGFISGSFMDRVRTWKVFPIGPNTNVWQEFLIFRDQYLELTT